MIRVLTSHDSCTSGTIRGHSVASLQRLKMEHLIPAPADCEVRSVIKFLNAHSIAPIEVHRQLCQVYGHTRLYGQHISCRSSAGRCLITIHPISRTSRPVIFIFPYTLRNSSPVSVSVFRMTERWRWVSQWFQSQGQTCTTHDAKVCPTVWHISIPEANMLKNSSKLAASVPISLFITLGFVSVNGPRESYSVDGLCT